MKKPRLTQRHGPKHLPPKRSYSLALWSLVVTLLILGLKVLPYMERW